MDDEKFHKILPALVPLVKKALQTELMGGSVELSKIKGNYKSSDEKPHSGHYFTFILPYAGKHIEWEILFNPLAPSLPPDFLCSEEIDCDPDAYEEAIKKWDPSSESCLANLLKELVRIYHEHQLFHLSNYFHPYECYRSLVKAGISEDDIEVCPEIRCPRTSERTSNILVKLNLATHNFSHPRGIKMYAGLLFVLNVDGSINSQALVVSPFLERVLGSQIEQLRLPTCSKQSIDPSVFQDISKSLNEVLNNLQKDLTKRRHIVASLLDLYPDNVVDYDKLQYENASLHFMVENSRYVAHFQLTGEMELVLFAMDKPLKVAKDETVMFNESEAFPLAPNYSSPKFSEALHEAFSLRLEKFIDKVNKLPPV